MSVSKKPPLNLQTLSLTNLHLKFQLNFTLFRKYLNNVKIICFCLFFSDASVRPDRSRLREPTCTTSTSRSNVFTLFCFFLKRLFCLFLKTLFCLFLKRFFRFFLKRLFCFFLKTLFCFFLKTLFCFFLKRIIVHSSNYRKNIENKMFKTVYNNNRL